MKQRQHSLPHASPFSLAVPADSAARHAPKTISRWIHLLASSLLFACLSIASGQPVINVNFGGGFKTGQAATGVETNDFWNVYHPTNSDGSLYQNGALAPLYSACGTNTSAGMLMNNVLHQGTNAFGDAMFDPYLAATNGTNLTIVLTNVPFGLYDVYLYGHGEVGELNATFDLTSPWASYGQKSTTTASDWSGAYWAEDAQYVVFRDVQVPRGQPLTIQVLPTTNGVSLINGLQLVAKAIPDQDSDGDGLFDADELARGTNPLKSDTDSDGRLDGEEVTDGTDALNPLSVISHLLFTHSFDSTSPETGQQVEASSELVLLPTWTGTGLWANTTTGFSHYAFPYLSAEGRPAVSLFSGTIRLWFKPDWSSLGAGGSGPGAAAVLLEARHSGGQNSGLAISIDVTGSTLTFQRSVDGSTTAASIPLQCVSNRWCSIALAYSASNILACLDGVAITNVIHPLIPLQLGNSPDLFSVGARINKSWDDVSQTYAYAGQNQANGTLEALEIHANQLTAVSIATDFNQTYIDSDGDGIADLQEAANGTDKHNFFNGTLPTIELASGDSQMGVTNRLLADPLVVRVKRPDGTLWAGAPVQAQVGDGDGNLLATTNSLGAKSLRLLTNPNGEASVFYQMSPQSLRPNTVLFGASAGGTNRVRTSLYAFPVIDAPPAALALSSPTGVVATSLVHLRGTASLELKKLALLVEQPDGEVEERRVQLKSAAFTTNGAFQAQTFELLDVYLTMQTNVFRLSGIDVLGRLFETNILVSYEKLLNTNAISMTIDWPPPSITYGSTNVLIKGRVSDVSAEVLVYLADMPEVEPVSASIQRDGVFWVEDFELVAGMNNLVVVARNDNDVATTNTLSLSVNSNIASFDAINSVIITAGSNSPNGYSVSATIIVPVGQSNDERVQATAFAQTMAQASLSALTASPNSGAFHGSFPTPPAAMSPIVLSQVVDTPPSIHLSSKVISYGYSQNSSASFRNSSWNSYFAAGGWSMNYVWDAGGAGTEAAQSLARYSWSPDVATTYYQSWNYPPHTDPWMPGWMSDAAFNVDLNHAATYSDASGPSGDYYSMLPVYEYDAGLASGNVTAINVAVATAVNARSRLTLNVGGRPIIGRQQLIDIRAAFNAIGNSPGTSLYLPNSSVNCINPLQSVSVLGDLLPAPVTTVNSPWPGSYYMPSTATQPYLPATIINLPGWQTMWGGITVAALAAGSTLDVTPIANAQNLPALQNAQNRINGYGVANAVKSSVGLQIQRAEIQRMIGNNNGSLRASMHLGYDRLFLEYQLTGSPVAASGYQLKFRPRPWYRAPYGSATYVKALPATAGINSTFWDGRGAGANVYTYVDPIRLRTATPFNTAAYQPEGQNLYLQLTAQLPGGNTVDQDVLVGMRRRQSIQIPILARVSMMWDGMYNKLGAATLTAADRQTILNRFQNFGYNERVPFTVANGAFDGFDGGMYNSPIQAYNAKLDNSLIHIIYSHGAHSRSFTATTTNCVLSYFLTSACEIRHTDLPVGEYNCKLVVANACHSAGSFGDFSG